MIHFANKKEESQTRDSHLFVHVVLPLQNVLAFSFGVLASQFQEYIAHSETWFVFCWNCMKKEAKTQEEPKQKIIKMDRKNVRSRAYHSLLDRLRREGMDDEEAKVKAREAAQKAEDDARAAGTLWDP